jgi:hypothetical protein
VANPDEVEHIFTHPLRALLDEQPPEDGLQTLPLAARGEWWPHEEEYHASFTRFRHATNTDVQSRCKTVRGSVIAKNVVRTLTGIQQSTGDYRMHVGRAESTSCALTQRSDSGRRTRQSKV